MGTTMTGMEPSMNPMAAGVLDDVDARILGEIAELYATLDPVPTGLVDRIQFGVTLDALHAEIAELQRMGDLAGVRGGEAAEAQTVTFTSARLTTMVTITPSTADRVRIDGWVAPGGGVSVELRLVDDRLATTADADGRFVFEDVPRGLAQFVLRMPGTSPHPPVVTPSITL
jgi:hypothetical protein